MFIRNYDADLIPLLKKLRLTTPPFFVDVRPDKKASTDPVENINNKIKLKGGSLTWGWKFKKNSLFIEAIAYPVYQSPNNLLSDITPGDCEKISFLPMPSDYLYTHPENIRINTSGNLIIDDFIKIQSAVDQLKNQVINGKDIGEIFIEFPELLATKTLHFAEDNQSDLATCFCGSELPYKNCFHNTIDGFLAAISNQEDISEWSKDISCKEQAI